MIGWLSLAAAGTTRLAVIASSNEGAPGEERLLWADHDAASVGDVLRELGGVRAEDVWVVPGATIDRVASALGEAVLRSTEARARGDEVQLWVYYTGHAGTDGLHLGGEVLSMAALKAAARVVPADERVFVVDACQSGQILRTKGAQLVDVDDAPADLVPPLDEAWIASTGAEENAFEVDRRRGALFTHFFISGARGAADRDHDDVVTLSELYGFVHARTSAEAADLGYVQEPRWAGALGDVVVTDLRSASSGVVAEGPVQQALLLIDERRGDVVAEIPKGAGARIAVGPGRYQLVSMPRGPQVHVSSVVVADGWVNTSGAALRAVRGVRTRGGVVDLRSGGWVVGAVAATGRTPGSRVGPGLFAEHRRALGRGVDGSIGLTGARWSFDTDTSRGTDSLLSAVLGARLDLAPGPARTGPAADVAAGALHQRAARAPHPTWGAWYGSADAQQQTTVPWLAVHAGWSFDVPIGPHATVMSAVAGPAVHGGDTPRVVADLAIRWGFEWGGRR